jgi:hypothetical protein
MTSRISEVFEHPDIVRGAPVHYREIGGGKTPPHAVRMAFRVHPHRTGVTAMKSEDTIPLLIPRKDLGKAKTAHFVHSDKTVGVSGEFPELMKAVRDGDLETVSILCAQLFVLNSVPSVLPALYSILT